VEPDVRLSVILPVLDEERRIGERLAELAAMPGVHEVLVVDGGSRDRTCAVVEGEPRVRLLHAPRGRALQMNAGAQAATGDVLLFLHADVALPPEAVGHILWALEDPRTVAGAFKTWTVAEGVPTRLGPLLRLADLRSRYTHLPYGDQALFVRAEAFRAAGGFPSQPLMEDLELARRLRRLGRITTVDAQVRVSGRRFLARPVFYFLAVNLFPLAYALGVSPATLLRLYRHER
jgi:rSAM/selenodomain-associated transferase 2